MPTATALAPYLAAERAKEAHRKSVWDREHARTQGVGWSAMSPGPFVARTEAQILAAAKSAMARAEAYRASPAGRFQAAAVLIAQATGDERLLACASRGLPSNAAVLLAGMTGPGADAARAALADFQSSKQQRAA